MTAAALLLAAVVACVAFDFWFRFGHRFVGNAFMRKERGKVFLTFDDGPASHAAGWGDWGEPDEALRRRVAECDPQWDWSRTTTENLLRVLHRHRAHAIFFVRGDVLEADAAARALVARMDTEGHAVGNHSHSHERLASTTAQAAIEQLVRADRVITRAIAKRLDLFRPPYGTWHVGLTWRAWRRPELRHYALPIHWSHATHDWDRKGDDLALDQIEAAVDLFLRDAARSGQGVVLLQHDVWVYSVLFTHLLLERMERAEANLRIGEPSELVAHAREVTARVGPLALGFYLRDRIGRLLSPGHMR